MSLDLSSLNEQQLAAVKQTEGAVLVTAGAGSGKTRMLTHRIAYLIEEKGVRPYNILAITFTNKAADEMRDRLERMIPEAQGLWVSTFHSMCVRILRRYIDRIGYSSSFSVYSEQEKDNVLKKLTQNLDDKIKSRLSSDDSKALDRLKKRAGYIISDAKNLALSADEYETLHSYEDDIDILCDLFRAYENELRKNNALDFDDLLVKTYQLLSSDPEALEYYRSRFHYIHVDEFQDTNAVQYMLVRLLALPRGNVCAVGDEDQCIYGWRGANVGNIVEFTKDFDCKVFKLERNYRSTKKILSLANSVIKNNTQRLDKTLWTNNGEGENVTAFCARNETNEAEYVADVIKKLVEEGEYSYSDCAVLMRINSLSRSFEERFLAYGIPYKMFGGFKFFERKEIKDLLAYLRIIVNGNDNEAILRVINFPKRGIGAGAISQLINYSDVTGRTLIETVLDIENNTDLPSSLIKKVAPFATLLKCLISRKDDAKPHELVAYLVQLLNLAAVYGDDTEESYTRKMNVSSFIEEVKQYEQSNPEATIDDYLQMITLYSDLDEMNGDDDCVSLATIHSVKGLEFKVVFIVGCEEGVLPLSRAMDSLDEIEEERRLAYVAITRAMRRLYITWAASRFMYSERKYTVVSRFLKEAGLSAASRQPSAELARERAREYMRDGYGYGSNYGGGYSPAYRTTYSPQSAENKSSSSVYAAASKPKEQTKDLGAYKVGTVVSHKKFGRGTIVSLSDEAGGVYAEINFDNFGKMLLSLQYAPLQICENAD